MTWFSSGNCRILLSPADTVKMCTEKYICILVKLSKAPKQLFLSFFYKCFSVTWFSSGSCRTLLSPADTVKLWTEKTYTVSFSSTVKPKMQLGFHLVAVELYRPLMQLICELNLVKI